MAKALDGKNVDLYGLVERVTSAPDQLLPLHEVWRRLTRGEWQATDALCDEHACYLFMKEKREPARPAQPQQLRLLEAMLRGAGQKILAMDLGLACSTVATTAKQALASLGFECLPSRVPLALVLVAQARETAVPAMGRLCAFLVDDECHYVLAAERPDQHLSRLLPPAEVEVVKARIEGRSHQHIARLRRTSERTIANQLASAARRLGVSGRLELIEHLAQQRSPLN